MIPYGSHNFIAVTTVFAARASVRYPIAAFSTLRHINCGYSGLCKWKDNTVYENFKYEYFRHEALNKSDISALKLSFMRE